MSSGTLQNKNLSNKHTAEISSTNQSIETWVRNPSWIVLPTVLSTDQKFVGLLAIYPESTFCALVATGAYTIDWGDGNIENIATGVQANHTYDYTTAALNNSNAPVTFIASNNTVNRTGHGYTDGSTVKFYNIITTTAVAEEQTYYVINSTIDSFQISYTLGGTALSLLVDGSATLLPYKQAIVTVTPQAGQNLTSLDLNKKNSTTGLLKYESGWLDIVVGSPNFTATGLTLASGNAYQNFPILGFALLEQVSVTNFGNVTNAAHLFYAAYSLRSVILASTASINTVFSMFTFCQRLTNVPLFDTSSVTNMRDMFSNCSLLETVPLFNTSAVTNMYGMFTSCYNLKNVPLFNTGNVTNMSYMFTGCASLEYLPLFNTANVTDMSYILNNCYNLKKLPLFNTIKVTNFSNAFSYCYSLTNIPLFNTAAVTDMTRAFQGCNNLKSVPLLNTALVTSFNFTFSNCQSLTSVPLFNTISATNLSYMFQNCFSLAYIPLFNTANALNMSNMFVSCSRLYSVPLFNTVKVTDMSNMFNNCYTLETVPLFNTVAVTSMSVMFSNCYNLKSVPLFNTAVVTNMSAMFSNCRKLAGIPLFNTTSVQNVTGMFTSCYAIEKIPALNLAAVTSSANFSQFVNINNTQLARIQATGIKYTFSVASCKLSEAALNEIYTNLPIVTGQTITVTGNYGTTGDDPTIATAKGWTVSG